MLRLTEWFRHPVFKDRYGSILLRFISCTQFKCFFTDVVNARDVMRNIMIRDKRCIVRMAFGAYDISKECKESKTRGEHHGNIPDFF